MVNTMVNRVYGRLPPAADWAECEAADKGIGRHVPRYLSLAVSMYFQEAHPLRRQGAAPTTETSVLDFAYRVR
jgi:hypothetical protein